MASRCMKSLRVPCGAGGCDLERAENALKLAECDIYKDFEL